MTHEDPFARRPAQSPYTIRHKTFGTHWKGLDPDEVTQYLGELAEQIEYADADRAGLRAEVERLRNSSPDAEQIAHLTEHAALLLSQAQQIADGLVAEAERYAKELAESARGQTTGLENVRPFTRVPQVQPEPAEPEELWWPDQSVRRRTT